MSEETGQALSALLGKLETATGPSRELDEIIARVLFGRAKPGILRKLDAALQNRSVNTDLPRYSESLDCAMTLVPPEMLPLTMVIFSTPAKAGAQDGTRYVYFEGATPALALCIAAVRARLAGQKE